MGGRFGKLECFIVCGAAPKNGVRRFLLNCRVLE
jgi:hypothetical protein